MKTFFAITLLLGLFAAALGETVSSIDINKGEGQLYAIGSGSNLYEFDIETWQQNNKHQLTFISPTLGSAFYRKINGVKYLFQVTSDTITSKIVRFDLPFGNQATLTPAVETVIGNGYAQVTAYDAKQNIALTIYNARMLALNSLPDLALLDTQTVDTGLRRLVTAVVSNDKTHRAVVFWYVFSASAPQQLNLHVAEYDISARTLALTTTTFNENDVEFINSKLVYAGFDSSNNKYWAVDTRQNRLVGFNSNDMTDYVLIPLGASTSDGDQIAQYNFGAQLAYVVSVIDTGARVQEVDLSARTIRRSHDFVLDGRPATAKLDIEAGNLYLGMGLTSNDPTTLVAIDLGNFSSESIVLV